jgi:hypothetical protein
MQRSGFSGPRTTMHSMPAQPISLAGSTLLETQAPALLVRLQSAMRVCIRLIPGITQRASDLQRTLGISMSLAWHIHRFAFADDALAAIRNLPGAVGMARFLDAAKLRGAPHSEVDQVRIAFEEFESLARRFVENRSELESLLTGLTQDNAEQLDPRHRRAAYEAQSHFLGYRAEFNLGCFMFAPSVEDSTKLDGVAMRTMTGVRRFRRDVSIIIATMRADADEGPKPLGSPQPLAGVDEADSTGLLPQFCSTPMPVVTRTSATGTSINVEVDPPGLGTDAAVTCTIGHSLRAFFSRYRSDLNMHNTCVTRVRTPCKVLVQDVLVHRGLFDPTAPEVRVLSDHRDIDTRDTHRPCDQLPGNEAAVFMGSGAVALGLEDVPHYEELIRFACARMHWVLDEFDVYRCLVEYPVMPSSLITRFRLRSVE